MIEELLDLITTDKPSHMALGTELAKASVDLVRNHWDAVQILAGELLERQQLNGREVNALLRPMGIG